MGFWAKSLTGIALASSLLASTNAVSEEHDPLDWLERMSVNLHAHNYQGTFVLQRGQRFDTIRVLHAVENGGYRERLQTLTGSSREVVRSVDRLGTLKGSRGAGPPSAGSNPPQWPPAIAGTLLRAHDRYQITALDYDRIAGLPCFAILAQAADVLRFSHKYCIHVDSGFPLLSELIDSDGQLLERVVFTEIEFLDHVIAEDLEPVDYHARRVEVQTSSRPYPEAGQASPWSFTDLPPGFVPVIMSEKEISNDLPPALHFVLSDGLATVSVYVDRLAPGEDSFVAATRFGATHALAQPVDEFQVTVVGEVPQKTMVWITESLQFQDDTD